MWISWFVIAVGVLLFAGVVFEEFFRWSMIGFGVLWAVAIVIETLWIRKQERALGQGLEAEALSKAPGAIPPAPTADGKE